MAAKKTFHVHLNHGESDKMSMTSRQMYAYDVVAVAGQAAKDRLRNALIVSDENKEVVIHNPTSKHIETIEVFNLLGQKVLYKNIDLTTAELDMSSIPSGNYLVKVYIGENIETIKIAIGPPIIIPRVPAKKTKIALKPKLSKAFMSMLNVIRTNAAGNK